MSSLIQLTSLTPRSPHRRPVTLQVDGAPVTVPGGFTILQAIRQQGIRTPTLCYLENLTPVNVCRVCVVELEGSRALVPSCSRLVEEGMAVHTDTERVRHSRKLVLELLASSVDMSLSDAETKGWMTEYGAEPARFGERAAAAISGDRDAASAGHHHAPISLSAAANVGQPVKVDNDLYVRDYSKCILCYKCVEACGTDAQNTFAIAVAGRGFDARISTEYAIPLTDSACVYCGNCIEVCPTNALMFKSEHEMRLNGEWDEDAQTVTTTVCPYCGVGCNLELHIQDNRIVKATSPHDHDITHGNLCIKGRFGWEYVNNRDPHPK